MVSMKQVLGLILGGGQGNRLYPLTKERAKPAVPLAGKYRLIDIPMSNCLNAGIEKIAILTQYNSVSLHRHIYSTYTRDFFAEGWIQILAAEQTPRSRDWYQGTADSVRKQLVEIKEAGTRFIAILAGDHLYRMDYRKFIQFHVETGADVTVAVQPVGRDVASQLGILTRERDGRIVRFTEKPTRDALRGLESSDHPEKPFMASMGIYVFGFQILQDLLAGNGDDFGKDIIPKAVRELRTMGYVFDGYWEDIGTIERFYKINLEMTQKNAPFDFHVPDGRIYTHPRFLPTTEVYGAKLNHVLLTDGCTIHEAHISDSVIGLRSIIHSHTKIQASVIMGADFYETEEDQATNLRLGRPNVGIGEGTSIERAIVDKNARIGRNVQIRAIPNRPDTENENWVAKDGIVIVPKKAILQDGTVI